MAAPTGRKFFFSLRDKSNVFSVIAKRNWHFMTINRCGNIVKSISNDFAVQKPFQNSFIYRYFGCTCKQTWLMMKNNSLTRLATVDPSGLRLYASDAFLGEKELKMKIEELTQNFLEARELISDARDSQGTVYFSDDVIEAKEAVETTLNSFENLISQLDSDQKQQVQRSIGLKMQELKAQLQMIEELL